MEVLHSVRPIKPTFTFGKNTRFAYLRIIQSLTDEKYPL